MMPQMELHKTSAGLNMFSYTSAYMYLQQEYKMFQQALKETPAGRWRARKIQSNGEMHV
jgi:hypothetical protein